VPCAIPLWDGHAADRVSDVLLKAYAVEHSVEAAA